MTTGPVDAVAGQLAAAIAARLAFTALRGTEAVAIGEMSATGIVATGSVSGASFNPAWSDLVGPIAGAISGAVTYCRIVLASVRTRQPQLFAAMSRVSRSR